jgi:hypothetical protein
MECVLALALSHLGCEGADALHNSGVDILAQNGLEASLMHLHMVRNVGIDLFHCLVIHSKVQLASELGD